MKKSLIALAALATVATAAQAQSSVSVYGILDLNVQSVRTEGTGDQTVAGENALSTSRLGFRGVEDLGGGLKAEFQLESKLTPQTGVAGSTTANQIFNREAWVGLNSEKFGAIRLGTTDVSDAVNIDVTVSQIAELGTVSGEFGTDVSKVVRYSTPTYNGFAAQYGWASPSSTTAEVTNGTIKSAMAKYENGPLGLYVGHESKKSSANFEQKALTLGAKYTIATVTLGAFHNKTDGLGTNNLEDTSKEVKKNMFSAAVPVPFLGSGVTAHALYSTLKTSTEAAADYNEVKLALTKGFSKRTTGYVAYFSKNYKTTATADVDTAVVGIRHSF
jgi:predicted porin